VDQKFWDERYSQPGFRFGTEPNAFLAAQRHLLKPRQRALAIADGEGRNGVWLAQQGLEVLSVDFSALALAKAQQLAAERNVAITTTQVDLATWKMPVATFDVVAAIFIQFAEPEFRDRLFASMSAALKPGGLLLLQGYRPEQVGRKSGGPPFVEHMYTRGLLEFAFPNFHTVEINEYEAELNEGPGHVGLAALIGFSGFKM
jgi:cyclopropane fatty-acyl-phospholipid synthase-like methyltransferase